ncbi:LLM class flavin-dependent oxidoreductase [Oerskovia sp. M15]
MVREHVERGRVAAGTSAPPEHQLVAFSLAVVHDDVATARAIVRPALATFGAADWSAQIDPLPFAAEFRGLRDSTSTPEEFARAMPDEWVDQLAIVGSPQAVRARIAALEANGVSSVVVVPTSPDPERPDDPFAALDALARVIQV